MREGGGGGGETAREWSEGGGTAEGKASDREMGPKLGRVQDTQRGEPEETGTQRVGRRQGDPCWRRFSREREKGFERLQGGWG